MSQAQVDGRQLKNVSATQLQGRAVASTAPSAGQALAWNGSQWAPTSASSAATQYFASTYNFAALTPAQTLTGSSPATVTLSPFPSGITSALSPNAHYLYITDGIAGNEAVLITATNGTSTVTFTPGSSHTSGNWTIASASGGVQEALYVVASLANKFGTVVLDSGIYCQVHGTIFGPSNSGNYAIDGQNPWATPLVRASDFPNGNLITGPSNSMFSLLNVGISNNTAAAQTSGAGVEFRYYSTVENCFITGGYRCVVFTGCAATCSNNFVTSSSHTIDNVLVRASATQNCTDINWVGGQVFGGTDVNSAAFRFTGVDGGNVSDVMGGGATNYFYIVPANSSPSYVANLTIRNNFVDAVVSGGRNLRIDGPGASTSISKVLVSDNVFLGGTGTGASAKAYNCIDIAYAVATGSLGNIRIDNCFCQWAVHDGIAVGNVTNSNVVISNCTSVEHGGSGIYNEGNTNLQILGCTLNSNAAYGFSTNYTSNVTWIGGECLSNALGTALVTVMPSFFVVSNIRGLTDMSNNVNVASSISAGLSSYTIIGGTAGTIDNLTNIWPARIHTLVNASSGSITISGTGNIPVARTILQYGAVQLIATDLGGGLKWY